MFCTNARTNVSAWCKILLFFFVWTSVENDYLLVRIERDEHFISEILPKSDDYFFVVFLPKVVFRKRDLYSDNKQKHLSGAMF